MVQNSLNSNISDEQIMLSTLSPLNEIASKKEEYHFIAIPREISQNRGALDNAQQNLTAEVLDCEPANVQFVTTECGPGYVRIHLAIAASENDNEAVTLSEMVYPALKIKVAHTKDTEDVSQQPREGKPDAEVNNIKENIEEKNSEIDYKDERNSSDILKEEETEKEHERDNEDETDNYTEKEKEDEKEETIRPKSPEAIIKISRPLKTERELLRNSHSTNSALSFDGKQPNICNELSSKVREFLEIKKKNKRRNKFSNVPSRVDCWKHNSDSVAKRILRPVSVEAASYRNNKVNQDSSFHGELKEKLRCNIPDLQETLFVQKPCHRPERKEKNIATENEMSESPLSGLNTGSDPGIRVFNNKELRKQIQEKFKFKSKSLLKNATSLKIQNQYLIDRQTQTDSVHPERPVTRKAVSTSTDDIVQFEHRSKTKHTIPIPSEYDNLIGKSTTSIKSNTPTKTKSTNYKYAMPENKKSFFYNRFGYFPEPARIVPRGSDTSSSSKSESSENISHSREQKLNTVNNVDTVRVKSAKPPSVIYRNTLKNPSVIAPKDDRKKYFAIQRLLPSKQTLERGHKRVKPA